MMTKNKRVLILDGDYEDFCLLMYNDMYYNCPMKTNCQRNTRIYVPDHRFVSTKPDFKKNSFHDLEKMKEVNLLEISITTQI